MTYRPLIAALAIAIACAPSIVYADDVVFEYEARELQSAQGYAQLMDRVRTTARISCRSVALTGFPASRKSCRDDIEAQLIDAIGAPAPETLASAARD